MIHLISQGGNLNILNSHGQTPIAFGSESVLSLLNLKDALATFEGNQQSKQIPSEFDNHNYLQKPVGKEKSDLGILKFDYTHRRSSSLENNPKGIQIKSVR